ncbi:MAG: hypothetical protein V4616_09530, partial [Bacteroidota bacterium]
GGGNGGLITEITDESEANILRDTAFYTLDFKANKSPVGITVVDPLKIRDTEWTLKIIPGNRAANGNRVDSSTWVLSENAVNPVRPYTSKGSLSLGSEQLILEEGLSVNIVQRPYFQEGTNLKTNFLLGEMIFSNPFDAWLSGVPDRDGESAQNWIHSGLNVDGSQGKSDRKSNADFNQMYEGVLGGTWTPYALVADSIGTFITYDQSESAIINREVEIARTTACDVVFTSDKSKWTRCPVIEAQDDPGLAEGGVARGRLRAGLSVDKNGLNINQGGNADECNLVSGTGMGWFPGYAINPESGERLNMAFSEDSWLTGENGKDMIWNPTSNINALNGEYVAGGKHFIIVFKTNRAIATSAANTVPYYDNGATITNMLKTGAKATINRAWRAANWVGLPLLAPGSSFKTMADGFITSDVRVKLRVSKEYEPLPVGKGATFADSANADSINNFFPMYYVKAAGFAPTKGDISVAKDALSLVRAVPNPYYGYSGAYDEGRLDNKIKITNLPSTCTISIYTVDGTLVRKLEKDASNKSTSVEWNLKTFSNLPCASGAYIIHVNAPGVGEKVIKWFGVMRQVDLQNL